MGLDTGAILDKLMEVAKKSKAAKRYSQDEEFSPCVVIVGPMGEVGTLPMNWRNEREKYAMMKAVSEVARETLAQAVVLISDVRMVESDKFTEHFKVPSVEEVGVEAFGKRYHQIMHEPRYDGQVKNLPRHLWVEALMVVSKGPRIGIQLRKAFYEEGPNDTVRFTEDRTDLRHDAADFRLLPDWWV